MKGKKVKPLVGVVVGSTSDLKIMEGALRTLRELEIPHEVTVASAHRTPDKTSLYARSAREKGLQVIIAAAGYAAHLAGAIAALTDLPVIGVPIPSSPLLGMDALLSCVQMPAGVPVATLAVGEAGAVNAALLAARILAVGDPRMASRLRAYREAMALRVTQEDKSLKKRFPL